MTTRHRVQVSLLATVLSAAALEPNASAETTATNLLMLDIEDLMQLPVELVSRYSESWFRTAASVHVLTGEDIRRSGVTTIADALRYVPGMEVDRISSSSWGIGVRSSATEFTQGLLVLMDGRTVYSPLYSGVFWDVQDTFLEDIERIEVVRGPGATLWGANAVNGVVNVVTKSARDTQGFLYYVGGGLIEREFVGLRYGGRMSDGTFYRVWGKFNDRDEYVDASGNGADDAWTLANGGFRFDHYPDRDTSLTVQGSVYGTRENSTVRLATVSPPYTADISGEAEANGGNLMVTWNSSSPRGGSLRLKTYYDRTDRRLVQDMEEVRDTIDLDLQQGLDTRGRHHLMWGAGYRVTQDRVGESFAVRFQPAERRDDLPTAFVQDEMRFADDRFRLTVGTKVEHNDYSGVEIQPRLRGIWTPDKFQSVWASVSRAVRTPNRSDEDIRYVAAVSPIPSPEPTNMLVFVDLVGTDNLAAEETMAYEFGYRVRPNDFFNLDLTLFCHNTHNIIEATSFETLLNNQDTLAPSYETDPAPPHLLLTLPNKNVGDESRYGVELLACIRPTASWSLQAGGMGYISRMYKETEDRDEDVWPKIRLQLVSSMDLPCDIEFDAALFYRASSDARLVSPAVPSGTRLDIRIGWRLSPTIDLSIVGQNLLYAHRQENSPLLFRSDDTEVPRSVFAKLTQRF